MKYGKYNLGQLEAILNMIGGEEKIDLALAGQATITITPKVIAEDTRSFAFLRGALHVNYARSVTDSVKAGKYDWKNPDINDINFPSTETGGREVEYGVFYFGKNMSSDKVIAEMNKAGYRPATLKELLAYGEKYPDEQRKYPIVALGSAVHLRGLRQVGCLYRSDRERDAILSYYNNDWDGSFRFLAVRK